MSKYQPLSERLSGHPEPEWRVSYAEIEQVLGFPLPKAARSGGAWWGRQGFIAKADPKTGEITFWRGEVAPIATPTPPAKQHLDMKVGAQVASVVSHAPKWGLAAAVAGGVALLGVVGGLLLRGKMRNPTQNS